MITIHFRFIPWKFQSYSSFLEFLKNIQEHGCAYTFQFLKILKSCKTNLWCPLTNRNGDTRQKTPHNSPVSTLEGEWNISHPVEWRKFFLTVCSCHVTYAFQSESTLCSCLNVKELLARKRRKIWSLSDCNWAQTHNHLVRKWTLNHFAVYKLSGCEFEPSCSHLKFLLSVQFVSVKPYY